jgi:hypothetical protein
MISTRSPPTTKWRRRTPWLAPQLFGEPLALKHGRLALAIEKGRVVVDRVSGHGAFILRDDRSAVSSG